MSEADPKAVVGEDDEAREAYYAGARSWAVDSERLQRRSGRLAWIIAAVATCVAVLEALALVALAPIKEVVPYTLLVDRTTGYVQVLEGKHPQTVKPQTALTQSMLAQYVVARESFEINGIAEQYKRVTLWSGEAARRDYVALMPMGNPMSPLNVYPRNSIVTTTIESVTPSGQDTAQVRFVTERRDRNQGAVSKGWYIAQLRYRYTGEPMSLEDRLANPLGFQVIEYRRDQEAVPQQQAGTPVPVPAPPMQPPGATPAPGAPHSYAVPIGPRAATQQPVRPQGGM